MTFQAFRLGLLGLTVAGFSACGDSNNPSRTVNLAPSISQIFSLPEIVYAGQPEPVVVTVFADDTNGDSLSYNWQQLDDGPIVSLQNIDQESVQFSAPSLQQLTPDNTVVLQVTVSDGIEAVERTITITILDSSSVSRVVSASANPALANTGELVLLQGSVEPAADGLNYSWLQTQGPAVSVSNAADASASFIAPQFDSAGNAIVDDITLAFTLAVTTPSGDSVGSADVSVRVAPLPVTAGPSALYVALNGANSATQVVRMTESNAGAMDYGRDKVFNSVDNEGIAIDINGNAMQVGDHADQDFGGVSTICKIATRPDGAAFADGDPTHTDREIRGVPELIPFLIGDSNKSGLGIPGAKGLTIAHSAGRVIVANHAGQNIKVFSTIAEGDVAALATITLGANPWDVAYDESRDILYVSATNGRIIILDDFLATGNGARETRNLRLVDSQGQNIASNLHGIAYAPAGDRLVVSDVGPALEGEDAGNGDGALFVLRSVSSLNGDIASAVQIAGTNTQLGDPVDLVLNGRDVIVAEKANSKVLIFKGIFTSSGGNVTPSRIIDDALESPESVGLEYLDLSVAPSVSDLVAGTNLSSILLAVSGDSPAILRAKPGLGGQALIGRFDLPADASDEFRLSLTRSGDGLVMGHAPGGTVGSSSGYLYEINRLAYARAPSASGATAGSFEERTDRVLSANNSSNSALTVEAPGGFDIDEASGLMYVTEAEPADGIALEILVFSQCGTGEPIASVAVEDPFGLSSASPGVHLDYDPESGDLYVALSNGRLAVYRDFNLRYSDNPEPQIVSLQRIHSVTGLAESTASSLSGIEYIAATDTLVLSGIGKIDDSNSGGQIFILQGASNLGSTKLVNVFINGGESRLANPIDIAFDGTDLFVLDAGSKEILRFANLLLISDGQGLAPAATASLSSISGSITDMLLVPDYLARTPASSAP